MITNQLEAYLLLFAIMIPWVAVAAGGMYWSFGIYVPKSEYDEEAAWWCTPLTVLLCILLFVAALGGIYGTVLLVNHLAGM